MSSINIIAISKAQQEELLSKFPLSWRDKLTRYTGEELFYFYKLCCMTPKSNMVKDEATGKWVKTTIKDMFFLALRAKFYNFMEGKEKYPIHGEAWIKLHHKFRYSFEVYCGVDYDEPFNLEEAKIAYAREKAKAEGFDAVKAVALLAKKFKRLA